MTTALVLFQEQSFPPQSTVCSQHPLFFNPDLLPELKAGFSSFLRLLFQASLSVFEERDTCIGTVILPNF